MLAGGEEEERERRGLGLVWEGVGEEGVDLVRLRLVGGVGVGMG